MGPSEINIYVKIGLVVGILDLMSKGLGPMIFECRVGLHVVDSRCGLYA